MEAAQVLLFQELQGELHSEPSDFLPLLLIFLNHHFLLYENAQILHLSDGVIRITVEHLSVYSSVSLHINRFTSTFDISFF